MLSYTTYDRIGRIGPAACNQGIHGQNLTQMRFQGNVSSSSNQPTKYNKD